MKRRNFIRVAGLLCACGLLAKGGALANVMVRRKTAATPAGRYPGRVKRLDFKSIARRGGWQG